VEKYPDAMRAALKLGDMDLITSTFASCTDKQVKRQLAFMLARQGVVLDHEDGPAACPDDLEAIQVPYPCPSAPATSRSSCKGGVRGGLYGQTPRSESAN
jgi:hypothetical protein